LRKAITRLENQRANFSHETKQITADAPDSRILENSVAARDKLTRDIETIENETAAAEKLVHSRELDLKMKRDAATQARLDLNDVKTERETLARLLVPSHGEDYPAIVDSLIVTPGYETALGAALGDDLEAPTALDAPVHWKHIETQGSDGALPDGIDVLGSFVESPLELKRRLNQIGVVEKTEGSRLQQYLQPGQRLVSRQGDLWRWDGYVAACEGTTAAAQRLEQRNRMNALTHEEVSLQESLEACLVAEQNCLLELTSAREDEKRLRAVWREMQTQLSRLRDDLNRNERASHETQTKLAALNAAMERCQQDLSDAQEQAQTIVRTLDEANGQSSIDLGSALSQAQENAKSLRSNAGQKQAALAAITREQQIRLERIGAQRLELEGWRQRAQDAAGQCETLKTRLLESQQELNTLADLPARMEAGRQQLIENLEQADKLRQQAADALAEAETTLKDTTAALRQASAAVSDAKEARARTQAKQEAAQERLEEDGKRIRETMNVEPEDCLALAELPPDAQPPSLSEVETRLSRLKGDRERLGGVNLQADDELHELTSQRDNLEGERNDVEQAILKLRAGIASLNREGRRRLNEAFQTVDAHFQKLFAVLFNGGQARLEMIQSEDDPLEGGLEIIARPPGKKPATLSLLSGGEQTLTALSLIFAVFLTNPSPICVLDEVDAPLDDANVDRFCTLMEKMAGETETRFLVITHHPMTMTRMNRLFGVTMAEKGISQLVSVDLETAQSFREAS